MVKLKKKTIGSRTKTAKKKKYKAETNRSKVMKHKTLIMRSLGIPTHQNPSIIIEY